MQRRLLSTLGLKIATTQLEKDQDRFGRAIASVLNLYAGTLNATALHNMLAIGAAKEFEPSWNLDFVKDVLTRKSSEFDNLREAFVADARGQGQAKQLIDRIILDMGYPADMNDLDAYEEGMLYAFNGILSELADKVKADTRNGMFGQSGMDVET